LFSDEVKAGLQEARAHHPCVIMGKKELEDGSTMVRVMPISHTPPDKTTPAVELNQAIKNHLGLDKQRQWIKTQELNRFTWPGEARDKIPVPIGPKAGQEIYGQMPGKTLRDASDQYQQHRARGRAAETGRDFDPKAEMAKLRAEREDAKNTLTDDYVKGHAKDTFDQVDERTKPKGNDRDDGRER